MLSSQKCTSWDAPLCYIKKELRGVRPANCLTNTSLSGHPWGRALISTMLSLLVMASLTISGPAVYHRQKMQTDIADMGELLPTDKNQCSTFCATGHELV